MRSSLKRDYLAILFLILAIFIVFFQLFTLDQAFLGGDHREQQYPWAKFLQSEIQEGRFPWWTSAMHCGFPLLAEGQIGAFYPVNLIFLLLFPIKFAYNYGILFQYLLGAVFFYTYLRYSLGRSILASAFASLIFLFGSTQGGYFYYNYISQKVVIWLPLALIWADRILKYQKFRDAFFLAVTLAFTVFGGYLQMAAYLWGFVLLYFLFLWPSQKPKRAIPLFFAALILGLFFSLPQLLPTYELSLLSPRANAEEGIAYIGSMNPLALATLLMPAWDGFLGSDFYVGLLGLFFALFSFFSPKTGRRNFFIFAAIFFLLLSLGKNTPVYVAIIKLTHFYSFRTPIKFLFFAAFALAVLAAFGFDALFEKKFEQKALKRIKLIFLWPGFLLWALIPFLSFFLGWGRNYFLPILKKYVGDQIVGKPGHIYSSDYYMAKAENFYNFAQSVVRLSDWNTLIEWLLLGSVLFFAAWLLNRASKLAKSAQIACILILFLDLFAYGFTSVKGNYQSFSSIDSPKSVTPIIAFLQNDPAQFRIMEVYSEPTENTQLPLIPNSQMTYGLQDIGAYSPLITKAYVDYLNGWGYTNDSLSARWVEPKKVLERLPELGYMNVKYILSRVPLENANLKAVLQDAGVTVYENGYWKPRAFFVSGIESLQNWRELDGMNLEPVDFNENNPQSLTLQRSGNASGLLVVSDLYFKNWNAYVEGKRKEILPAAGLFRAVNLNAGEQRLEMRYEPILYKQLGFAALLTAAVISVFLIIGAFRRRAA